MHRKELKLNFSSFQGLDRAQFIRIALLCGSDYTQGIPKIGPVKALEILAEFATKSPIKVLPEDTLARKYEGRQILQPLVEFK